MSDGQNKLHIDSDWKSQAQAEKQRLAEEARTKAPGSAAASASAKPQAAGAAGVGGDKGRTSGTGRQLPPADFRTLVSTMVTQAMFAMGMIPDPQTGRRMASLDMARHHIDMLSVIESKTKGNLDDEETKLLTSALYELRMQYVQLSQQVIAQQMGADTK
ncbi:MAG: DUF1844 domain-containing protein [Phycisphaeraceae bacterium]